MFVAAAMLAAFSVSAEIITPTVTHDPLMSLIMSRQLTQPGGGVTGAVRIGSGQPITLNLVDPLAPLTPAEGLRDAVAPKPRRKVRRSVEQLKTMSEDERRADWAGRKQPRD